MKGIFSPDLLAVIASGVVSIAEEKLLFHFEAHLTGSQRDTANCFFGTSFHRLSCLGCNNKRAELSDAQDQPNAGSTGVPRQSSYLMLSTLHLMFCVTDSIATLKRWTHINQSLTSNGTHKLTSKLRYTITGPECPRQQLCATRYKHVRRKLYDEVLSQHRLERARPARYFSRERFQFQIPACSEPSCRRDGRDLGFKRRGDEAN